MILERRLRQTIIKAVPVFLVTFFASLVIWVQVKDFYGIAVTFIASKIIEVIKGVKIDEMLRMKDSVQVTFYYPSSIRPDMLFDIPIRISTYTFNAPLTFAIMSSMYFFIQRRFRAFSEALLLLICVHLLFIISFELKLLSDSFMKVGLEPVSGAWVFIHEFLWGFTDNMVIRFEPFLIGFFMFIRFRVQPDESPAPGV